MTSLLPMRSWRPAKSRILRATENSIVAWASTLVSSLRTSVVEALEATGADAVGISLTLLVSVTRSMLGDLSAGCVWASEADVCQTRRITRSWFRLFITPRERQEWTKRD